MNALYTPTGSRSGWRPANQAGRGLRELRLTDAVNIDQFLRARGFESPEARRRAREVLERAGLTHAAKQAFVASKLDTADRLLTGTFVRACGDACVKLDRAGAGRAREVVRVPSPFCEICGGSNIRRAVIECVRVLRRRSISRVVVVGGSPNQLVEMRELFAGTGVDIRYVDGTQAQHTAKDALANRRWAQLIIIWGPTPLRHAISDLYTSGPMPDMRIVKITRRSIEALCQEVVRSYS